MRDVKLRIRQARREAGLTQKQLASRIGVERGAVGNWESLKTPDVPSLKNLAAVAKECQTTMAYLVAGRGATLTQSDVITTSLPVIGWSQITADGVSMDSGSSGFERFACPIPCSEESFILRVNTRAMMSDNPLEVSYPEGQLIYCDPDVASMVSAPRVPVIAWLPERGESVFRLLVRDGGQSWLQGLSREFPRIDEPFEARAVIIGLFSPTRL